MYETAIYFKKQNLPRRCDDERRMHARDKGEKYYSNFWILKCL